MKTAPNARYWMVAAVFLYSAMVPVSVSGATLSWMILAASLFIVLRTEKKGFELKVSGLEWVLAAYLTVGLLSAVCGVDFHRSFGRLQADANMMWIACLFAAALSLEPVPKAPLAWGVGMGAAALI